MSFLEQIDPELAPFLEQIPAELITAIGDDPPTARAMFAGMMEMMAGAMPPTDVKKSNWTIPGTDGDIPITIYQPPTEAPRGGLLWMHGGGYIIGSSEDDVTCNVFAEQANCTIVSVDYRMAPEHPAPAGTEDAYAALKWMVENADDLGIDTSRIAIGGASAGGGLSAGLALYNRDHDNIPLVLQLLIYPMIDDTHETPSGHEIQYEKVWNRDTSIKAWKMYLGDTYGTDNVSPYAAAARAEDVSGLPPTYICVGTHDLFRDEDIHYAHRLMAADVPTELSVVSGMFHGGELFAPTAAISQRMHGHYVDALKRALA